MKADTAQVNITYWSVLRRPRLQCLTYPLRNSGFFSGFAMDKFKGPAKVGELLYDLRGTGDYKDMLLQKTST